MALRLATLALGIYGLAWAVHVFPISAKVEQLETLGTQVLQSNVFPVSQIAQIQAAGDQLDRCDTVPQIAILQFESLLANAYLREGKVDQFDSQQRRSEDRAKQILSCSPRQSIVWLWLFGRRAAEGALDERSLGLLQMSYSTSSNEAWIALRRNKLAISLLPALSAPLRAAALREFRALISDGFQKDAAVSYAAASSNIKALLAQEVEHLHPSNRNAFWAAVNEPKS